MTLPLKLGTLDLLHIAYAKLLKDEGVAMQELITVDRNFMRATKILKEEVDIDLHII